MNFALLKMALGRRLLKMEPLRRSRQALLQYKTRRLRSNDPVVVVLSMGKNGHSYSAARAVKALGHKVLLVTDKPQLHEMMYSDALILRDPIVDTDAIIKELEAFKLEAAMVSIKHLLLPAQAHIAERFGLISAGLETGVLNNNKLLWRQALDEARVPQPEFSTNPDFFTRKTCIRKPISGTGSAGVVALGPDDDKTAYAGPDFFFESKIDGDQYDYEGVISDGKVCYLAKVFERYVLHNGTFVAHFFLFNPPIDKARDASLETCVERTLSVSKVITGAFHVEMRMMGNQAVPIDFANRMGYERFVSFASGRDFAQEHVNCFLPVKHELLKNEPNALVQYFCWNPEDYKRACEIRDANPQRVFDAWMRPHKFAGQDCLGMVAFKHDSIEELLAMTDGLGIFNP